MRISNLIAALSCAALTACGGTVWHGEGTPVGTFEGMTLFETSCTVDMSVVGQRSLYGPNRGNPITEYWACEGQARATCDGEFNVREIDRGITRRQTATSDNGFQRVTRTFPARDTTIRYTCAT